MDHLAGDSVWLATGHYADKTWAPKPSLKSILLSGEALTPRPQLMRPKDRSKDQTYYLSAIPEASLARVIFPLAPFRKSEVRAMAHKWGLPTAQREESMGICFVGEKRRFDDFISQYVTPAPGPIIDLQTGKTLGTHRGLWSCTIGQGARIRGMPQKMFVVKKDIQNNEIYVVPGSDNPALYCQNIIASNWQWIWRNHPPPGIDSERGFQGRIQFRHRMLDVSCTVKRPSCCHRGQSDETMHIRFDEPQKAVAPGQIATVWDGNWCLGCGTITEAV